MREKNKVLLKMWRAWRTRRANVILLLGGATAGLLCAELFLWTNGGVRLPPRAIECSFPHYVEHPKFGYSLRPNLSTHYEYPRQNPRRLSLVSNSDGFRSHREFDAPDGRRRVVVVGDSFVFGQGVEREERFTDVVEANRPTWRVDNLGMTGFGPDLMLMALREIGPKTDADAMILCVYTDDFRRVNPHYAGVGFKIPRFYLSSAGLRTMSYPRQWVGDRSYVIAAARNAWWRLADYEMRLNGEIIEAILDLAEEYGMRQGIVFLPGQADLPVDQARRAWLRRLAEKRNVPYLDMTASIHTQGEDAFIADNWHLSPLGHRVVAAELEHFIEAKLFKD